MANEVFEFVWQVPRGGFCWTDGWLSADWASPSPHPGEGEPARVLTACSGWDGCRDYDPLRGCPALFRTFADTAPTAEGVLAFANGYGALGQARPVTVRSPDDPGEAVYTMGEPLGLWLWHLAWMRQAVGLLDAVRQGGQAATRKLIRWEDTSEQGSLVVYAGPRDGPAGFRAPPGEPQAPLHIASGWPGEEGGPRFPPGDTGGPARVFLRRFINARLPGAATPVLRQDRKSGDTVLRLAPRTLIGCLWLQLAEAVVHGREQRECSFCRGWYEAKSRGDREEERHFCSPACRNKAYRRRQEEARAMFAAGRKTKKIAEALGVDEENVRRWVAGSKRTLD